MKLILIHEKDKNISNDVLLHAIRNDGYASIDDVNFYRILSYNDTHVILEDQNSGISVEYSDIKSIKHNLHKTVYRTDFNYLGANHNIYNVKKILNTHLICKRTICPVGVNMKITEDKSYYITSCNVGSIDSRVKVGFDCDDGGSITLDYEYFFKTIDDIRSENLEKILQ